MIEYLWTQLGELWRWIAAYFATNYHPVYDTLDILIVALGIYWLLLLIRGTRAVQVILGLVILLAVFLASQIFQLMTLSWLLNNFWPAAPLIIIILFQNDIRRALARVGRGLFRTSGRSEQSHLVEEIVRAAQALAQKRVGALLVLERETNLDDQIEAGVRLDAAVSKDLLTSIFLPYSPLHDGAVVIQSGRIAYAGCVLPLTLRANLPEGLGTRHRAALGITEETDAVVVVVSEETGAISVVAAGELLRDLDAPRLRVVLRDILAGEKRLLSDLVGRPRAEEPVEQLRAEAPARPAARPREASASKGGVADVSAAANRAAPGS